MAAESLRDVTNNLASLKVEGEKEAGKVSLFAVSPALPENPGQTLEGLVLLHCQH